MSKKVAKKTKKVKKKVVKKFDLRDITDDMNKFAFSVMDEESKNEEIAPYKIPFRHHGLQKTTGGVLGGKFLEIAGASQSGKSFLLYELMSEAVQMGGFCQLFDGERAFEEPYAEMVGLDIRGGHFAFGEIQTATQKKKGLRGDPIVDMDMVFKAMYAFITNIRKKVKDLSIPIVMGVDSYPALQCKVDIANMEKGADPRGYRAMQKNAAFYGHLERMIPVFDKFGATFILLNQLTKDHSITYGNPYKSNAEEKIKFWATQRLQGKLLGKLKKTVKSIEKKNGRIVYTGMRTEWTTNKNRAVRPFQTTITDVRYASGLDPFSGLVELLVNDELVKVGSTKFDSDGEALTKSRVGVKVIKEKEDFKDKFYGMNELNILITDYPEFLEPVWTGTFEEDDDEFEAVKTGLEDDND